MVKQQLNSLWPLLVIPLLSLTPGPDRQVTDLKKLQIENDHIRSTTEVIVNDGRRIDFVCQLLEKQKLNKETNNIVSYEFNKIFISGIPGYNYHFIDSVSPELQKLENSQR